MIDCAVRAYLLYLLGCTLFTDNSGTRVPLIYLTLLTDLECVRTYSQGAAALAYLYRQLGLATLHAVKQIVGYFTLLEAWIYKHFECLAPTPNIHCGGVSQLECNTGSLVGRLLLPYKHYESG